MTLDQWETVFDAFRSFMVAGVSIGLVAALLSTAHE